jgi:hypothetical protein
MHRRQALGAFAVGNINAIGIQVRPGNQLS